MAICCPACKAELAEGGWSCHECGLSLESGRSSITRRIALIFACLLILLTLGLNVIGWVRCRTNIDPAVMIGLLNGLLGLLLVILGLIARYHRAWLIGLAHLQLPSVVFALLWLFRMGPRTARPLLLWADAIFLAVVIPLSIVACYRAALLMRPSRPDLGRSRELPPADKAPRAVRRRSAKVARWLVAITSGIWLIGWLGCWLVPNSGIALGLVNVGLSVAMIVLGLRGRYPGTWKMGIAHCLFFVVISVVMAVHYGSPRKVRPSFIWLGLVYLANVAPLTWRIWLSVPTERHPMKCIKCGYLLYGLKEARCPECGTPFDPELLRGSNHTDTT